MKRFSLRNLSLRYVLLLALLLGLFVPSWLAYEVEARHLNERLSAELNQDRDRYAEMLSVTLSEPLWQLAPLFAAPLLDKIMEDPQVSSVVVMRLPDNRVFMERRKNNLGTVVLSEGTREIYRQEKLMGSVTVGVNNSALLASAQDAKTRFLWRTAGIEILALLIIFLVLQWRLTRPIDKLVDQAESLASGQLHAPLEWLRDDELGRVGHSLEQTRIAISTLVLELQNVNNDLRTENDHRRAAEDELARHAQELELRVTERTEELSSANATLSLTLSNLRQSQADLIESRKLASLGRMVAGLAHELNTPIGTALTVGTTIGERVRAMQKLIDEGQLKRSFMDDFLSNTKEASQVLERSLTRAAGLINSFKRVAERDATSTIESFELADIVTQSCEDFCRSPEAKGITLHNHVPHGIFMTSYPDLLSQALANVLRNAQMHAFDAHTDATITVDAVAVEGMVKLTVSDNGVGIPEEIQDRIFEPLFTARLGSRGLGLGLSLTQSIIMHNLGGRIHVRSNRDAGVSFVFTLPIMAPTPAATGERSTTAESTTS